ncbi:TetR/AcrR family transcriptional regulator [Knoellia koreensis]|uniref:TetR family transcriptional regulator n=1 Tax=Knoellia koreensis TaxID=2730921 RepID=A0A849HMT6_9MICO|nr:TetR/AcrR family transcriptional regulator [Knoellia sp. DB2414S]NNM47701.1 TetR family transcriptional regulator [Knoellia sp. DB2414S]
MSRWEPDAGGRLREAALELFATTGYEATTVAQIAARAGLTSRTFFRHFPDKPEVLFAGSDTLEQKMVAALRAAPLEASPRRALDDALDVAVALLSERADFARRRHHVIAANPALLERETMKLARLSTALATALHERGVGQRPAAMAAQAAVAAFGVAFDQWAREPGANLRRLVEENLDLLVGLVRDK